MSDQGIPQNALALVYALAGVLATKFADWAINRAKSVREEHAEIRADLVVQVERRREAERENLELQKKLATLRSEVWAEAEQQISGLVDKLESARKKLEDVDTAERLHSETRAQMKAARLKWEKRIVDEKARTRTLTEENLRLHRELDGVKRQLMAALER